ncbi:hypothetical protein E4U17_006093 [Claviceps sp. LM77 group G4]|nr:hypothetical protein E4U17_006093 [Claviceps sp. LM77 group G4]
MADPKPHTPQEQARISRKAAVSRDGSRVKEAVRLAAAAEPVDFPEAEIGRDLSLKCRYQKDVASFELGSGGDAVSLSRYMAC